MDKINWRYQFSDKRALVYLVWAVLVYVGFVATHYYQRKEINGAWALISLIGLGFMVYAMPLRQRRMQAIFAAWLVPITFGMIMSGLAFRVAGLIELTGYLGVFWLAVMGVGFLLNGIVDAPSRWYFYAALANFLAALFIYVTSSTSTSLEWQYLVAAIISGWSMLMLWVFRAQYQ